MTVYSYHVSQEQYTPSDLLQFVCAAEQAGFDGAFTSDHLQPWAPQQGHSGFSWAWLGAALQSTRRLKFGTITIPGGWRYQPVVVAQAIATLGEMFPGRLPWVALGSGEAVNERATGLPWPSKQERNERLQSASGAIQTLLAGDRVSCEGPPAVLDARLWCHAPHPTQLMGAATSVDTARWLGSWANGLLTTAPDIESLTNIVNAFREGGGEGKPIHIKVDISWAPDEALALAQAHANWRFNGASGNANSNFTQPEHFDAATVSTPLQDIRKRVFVSSRVSDHIDHILACKAVGVESVNIHNVGLNQSDFIDVFGAQVLPALRSAG
jgi:coenzyme F420-dependent glucose-6-phosphate dehydrogenase